MAKSVKLKDKNSNPLLPVTRSSLVEMNNGISLQTAYEGINSTHYTKDEINAMGYITTFNESDPTVPVFVKNITQDDITYWNNKADNIIYDIPTNCPNLVQEVYRGGANDGETFVNISNAALEELLDLTDSSKAYSRTFTLTGLDSGKYKFLRSTTDAESGDLSGVFTSYNRHIFLSENTYYDGTGKVLITIYDNYDYDSSTHDRVPNTTSCSIKITNIRYITTDELYFGDFSNWNPNDLGYEFYAQSPYSTYNFVKSELNSYVSKAEINEMGYLQNYTEYDPTVPSYVKGITQTDITNWNNKQDKFIITVTGISQNEWAADGKTFNIDKTASEISDAINNYKQIYVYLPAQYTTAEILDNFDSNGIDYNNIYRFLFNKGNEFEYIHNDLLIEGGLYNYNGTEIFYLECYKNVMTSDTIGDMMTEYTQYISETFSTKEEITTASYINSSSLNTTLASYVTSGYYDTSTHKIYLRHGTNVLSEIDANDFIKDGMVDTAYVQGSNLVISFNTDAGKQPVEIPIADIFNPTNYYTKTEIDNAGYLTSHQDLSSYVSKTELNAAGYLTAHQDIKTINGNTITGTGEVTISGLPAVNSTYNGKILQVVDGVWALVTPLNLYSGTGTPNNTQGNNGDLYMQI